MHFEGLNTGLLLHSEGFSEHLLAIQDFQPHKVEVDPLCRMDESNLASVCIAIVPCALLTTLKKPKTNH